MFDCGGLRRAQPSRQEWSFTGGALRQRAEKFTWKGLHVNLHFDKYLANTALQCPPT